MDPCTVVPIFRGADGPNCSMLSMIQKLKEYFNVILLFPGK